MLAGWFRLKFPNLVHASIASSAPVQAKVDMNEYNDVTAAACTHTTSGACLTISSQAIRSCLWICRSSS